MGPGRTPENLIWLPVWDERLHDETGRKVQAGFKRRFYDMTRTVQHNESGQLAIKVQVSRFSAPKSGSTSV